MSSKKEEGISAVNQDFIKYDQVDKPHTYHLAETGAEDEFDKDFVLKTCDLNLALHGDDVDKQRFADDLGTALREIGFAILVGHGVDTSLYDGATDRVIEFFTAPSLDEKMRYRAQRAGSVNQGYFPIKETSDIHPDLVEGWVFCRRAFDIAGPRDTP